MLLALSLGVVLSALLVFISARASAGWANRKQLWDRCRHTRIEGGPQGWGLAGLPFFAVAAGLPACLGLIDGNVLSILGAFMACMLGRSVPRGLFSSPPPPGGGEKSGQGTQASRFWDLPWVWFAVLAWSILTPGSYLQTFSLRRTLAAQAVVGPAVAAGSSLVSPALGLAFATGLISAVFWTARSGSIAGSADTLPTDTYLRWAEAALCSAALAFGFLGPAVGALVPGPRTAALIVRGGLSYLAACFLAAGISFAATRVELPNAKWLAPVAAFGALAALALASLVR